MMMFVKFNPPGTTEEFDREWYEHTLAGDWEPIRNHDHVKEELESLRKRIDQSTFRQAV